MPRKKKVVETQKHNNIRYEWFNGFVETFKTTQGEKSAESWYNHGMKLSGVIHITISDETGEVLYDLKRSSPYDAPKSEKKKPTRRRRSTSTKAEPKTKAPAKPRAKTTKPKAEPKAPAKPRAKTTKPKAEPKTKAPAKPRTRKKAEG